MGEVEEVSPYYADWEKKLFQYLMHFSLKEMIVILCYGQRTESVAEKEMF